MVDGRHGVYLEKYEIGGLTHTTWEAFQRFQDKINGRDMAEGEQESEQPEPTVHESATTDEPGASSTGDSASEK